MLSVHCYFFSNKQNSRIIQIYKVKLKKIRYSFKQKQNKKLTQYLGVLLKMVSYLEKKINNPSAQVALDLTSFFPIYSKSRAGAKSLSHGRGSVFNMQNRASNSWTTRKSVLFSIFSTCLLCPCKFCI